MATDQSALADNIDRKGRNAYYYAHAHKADGPVWDQKEEPRLLSKTTGDAVEKAAVVVAEPITNYAWGDEDMKVKIYIDLPDIGSVASDNFSLDWTPTSFTFTIVGYGDKNHKLAYGKLFDDIDNAAFKVKPNKVIVTLTKREDKSWPCINAGTPSK
jgi:hypothetical protein